jgi:hypothetical protein
MIRSLIFLNIESDETAALRRESLERIPGSRRQLYVLQMERYCSFHKNNKQLYAFFAFFFRTLQLAPDTV